MTKYKEIFLNIENTLKQQSWFSEEEFNEQFGKFKKLENRELTDNDYYRMLTMIIFYSGFKSSIVENKRKIILGHFTDFKKVAKYDKKVFQRISSDPEMIKNRIKIQSCINNAVTFENIVNKHGAFKSYLDSFHANESLEQLDELKNDLQYRFEYLGNITVYHFLTDIGFNVLKPDRVITRIFRRLGLIDHDKQYLKTVYHGRNFAKETGYPIRYVDIILVKYGQKGESKMFGLKNGICLELNPNCKVCKLKNYCQYYKNKTV